MRPCKALHALVCASLTILVLTTTVTAQGRAQRRTPPTRAPHAPVVRGQVVFIGGYFYDPFFGPYPWWPRHVYPHPYVLVYDRRAEVRILATPRQADVYVDGFYAGIVDDFDGIFQGLPLPPGGHTIELYLEGYRTARHAVYLRPGSTLKLRVALGRLPEGMASEPPHLAPSVPPPPDGSYRGPVTPLRSPPPSSPAPPPVDLETFGILEVTVQPADATVTVDGTRWLSSDEGRFAIHLPAGRHRLEVSRPGFRTFSQDVDIRAGEPTALHVSLLGS